MSENGILPPMASRNRRLDNHSGASEMIEIKVNGEVIPFKPGDSIDLGKLGLIEWFGEPSAEAVRILRSEHQKSVCNAIQWIKTQQTERRKTEKLT